MEILPDPAHVALLTLPFLVALFGLNAILWQPLLGWLEERESVARIAQREAKELEEAAAEQMAQIEGRLAEARRNAATVRQEARERALAREADMLAAARQQADEDVRAAVERIRAEQQSAKAALEDTAKELSPVIAARVLGRDLV